MKYFCMGYYKNFKEAANRELDLNLMLLTQCNQECSYCVFHCSPKKHEFVSDDVLNALAKKIVEYKKPVDLTLLGGEPTLHPRLKEIVDRYATLPNVSSITIHTNGRKSLKGIINKKLTLIFSVHPEYYNHAKVIIKHIQEVREEVNTEVKVLYHPLFINEIHFLEKALKENNIPFYRDPVIGFEENQQDFDCEDTCFNVNGRSLTLKYIASNKLNRFRDWMCLVHSVRVDIDGKVTYTCTGNSENVLDKNFKLQKQLILCTRDDCRNSCGLEALKFTR